MQFNKDSKIIILLVLLAFMAFESVRSQEIPNKKIAGYYISFMCCFNDSAKYYHYDDSTGFHRLRNGHAVLLKTNESIDADPTNGAFYPAGKKNTYFILKVANISKELIIVLLPTETSRYISVFKEGEKLYYSVADKPVTLE